MMDSDCGGSTPDLNIDGDYYIGTPDADVAHWDMQDLKFDCAVDAQRGIIEEFLHRPVSETEAVFHATANGWLTEGGTQEADMGNLLDFYHIPNHRVYSATVDDLARELAQGHKVIAAVHADSYWQPHGDQSLWHTLGLTHADHAIWVTGIDQSDPAHPQVIVNDSGTPNGAGLHIPLDRFLDAWHDSHFFYVATDTAPVGLASFDYNAGHYVGPVWDSFQALPGQVTDMEPDWYATPPPAALPVTAGVAAFSPADWDQILRTL